MTEPLRRRVRARLLTGLTRGADIIPRPILGGGLQCAARLAKYSRFEHVTLENLKLAYGDELDERERRDIAKGVRLHAARLFREWIELRQCACSDGRTEVDSEWIDERVELDASYEIMKELHARGRGVLILTAHIGNWELLAARLHREGYPGVVIGNQAAKDTSTDWLVSMRRAYGVTTMAQDSSAREFLRVLQRGETIGMLSDLEVRRLDGEFLQFFGTPALTMTAPAALARARKIPLLPARCILKGGRYVLSFEEPLELEATRDKKAANVNLLTRLNAVYERWIRETPEQWAWHQRRWRTRPGEWDAQPNVSWQARYGSPKTTSV